LHSQNVKDVENTAKAHEDVYDIMTQVKIDEKKQDLENEKTNDIKMPFKKNRKLEEQEDEEETDMEIIEIDDDENDDELICCIPLPRMLPSFDFSFFADFKFDST
jgi:hypothetical protein